MRRPPFIAFLFAAVSLSAAFGDSAWQRKTEKDGIVIETRTVPGSDFREFRASMRAKTSLEKAVAVMEDIPGYTGWMKDCKEARRIKQLSAGTGIIYSLQDTPWPIAPREAVVKYSFNRTGNPPAIVIALEAAPDALPLNSGRVRISRLRGYWKFFQTGPDSVEIVYSLHSEPGGNLPGWAVAAMVAHLPFETLRKLRDRLEN